MSEEDLEAADAPLQYIAEPRELSAWSDKLSVDAKRRFLINFWKKRDPTPGTDKNERRESYYAAVDYANKAFKEGGRNPVSGWGSDRGGVHAQGGGPDR